MAAPVLGAFAAQAAFAQISDDVIRIGVSTDLTGVYADNTGAGSVEAVKMAVADMGGAINGKKIEVLVVDHLNKGDIAASKGREWLDRHGVDVIIGDGASSAVLPVARIAAEKKKIYIAVGTSTPRLTNEECTPYTVHYAYDTVALSRGTAQAVTRNGGKSWYFITVDYAFGHSLEKEAGAVVEAEGGKVVGSARHPINAPDVSAMILQAQASKAQILGLANAGGDAINTVKAAREFGALKNMKMAGLLFAIPDVHALGLEITQGMYLTDGWYWDQSPESRAWSKRYFAVMKKQATMAQAGSYSAVTTYLKAVKATGTDDSDKVMAEMKRTPIKDMFTSHGVIRPDGRMVYDMSLMQVKSPAESKYPWDYFKKVGTVVGSEAYTQKAESKCALWK